MRRAAVRPLVIASMLGATSLLAAVLTAHAVAAARGQRASAERVLQDYAALGAEGVAQHLKSGLGSRFTTVLTAAVSEPGSGPVAVSALRPKLPGTGRDVLDALGSSGRILRVTATDSLAPLLATATAALPSYAYFGMTWADVVGGSDLVVFQPLHAASKQAAALVLSDSAVSALLSNLVARDPVLPPSLAHRAALDAGIGVRVTSAHGVLVNRRFDPSSRFRATLPLEQPYADLRVDVSLSESLAPALLIGGLPPSRVPLLVALFALTLAMTIASADQLRRELELSRLRDDFVSGVSHELRTPLAQIRMFAETIRLGRVRSVEEGERSVIIIENEARRLEHLVENLLHFSRSERGALQVHPEALNLTSLVQEVITAFVPLAARSDSRIALALEPDVHADVDPAAMRQIVLNLLDNAVKYGRQGQIITVRLSTTADGIRLEVEDEGSGIAARDRARVWERFWRSDSARRAGISGTGVGLAIVSDLVRLHGGTATVADSSDAAPSGARIIVTLPAARAHA